MKVRELIAVLQKLNPEARVVFDTEAQHYDTHLVTVAGVDDWSDTSDIPLVVLHEDHPHRAGCPNRSSSDSQE